MNIVSCDFTGIGLKSELASANSLLKSFCLGPLILVFSLGTTIMVFTVVLSAALLAFFSKFSFFPLLRRTQGSGRGIFFQPNHVEENETESLLSGR